MQQTDPNNLRAPALRLINGLIPTGSNPKILEAEAILNLRPLETKNQEILKARNGVQIGVKIFKKTSFLDFGDLFSKCCIPDESEKFDEKIKI